MITKAVYENGVLRPLEKLNLRQGEEVEIEIKAMSDWRTEIDSAIKDFINVAELAHMKLNLDDFEIEYLEAPHTPPSNLPNGKMAIYGFWLDGKWLKIGMVGPKSKARYTSQHYSQCCPKYTCEAPTPSGEFRSIRVCDLLSGCRCSDITVIACRAP